MAEHIEPHVCSHCKGPVLSRRPSSSGYHFCSARACQNRKQAVLRKLRMEQADAKKEGRELSQQEAIYAEIVDFVAAVAKPQRIHCNFCGATGVVPGWGHRRPDGNGTCVNEARGKLLGPAAPDLVDAAMPHLRPRPAPTPEVPADWVPPHLRGLDGPPVPLEGPPPAPAEPTGKAPF